MASLKKLLVPAAAALLGSAPACVIYDSDASATFTWDFAGRSCDEAGVHTVRVELEAYDADVFDAFSVPCHEGSVTFEELPVGTYFVFFQGIGGPYVWEQAADVDLHGGHNDFAVHLDAVGTR